jgi:GT2 family glycosyltransferase
MTGESAALRKPVDEPTASSGVFDQVMEAQITTFGPRVTAIIVSFHTGAPLWECLRSVERDSAIGEVVVVNNGNPPEIEHELEKFVRSRDKFRLVGGHGNVGFAKACNQGAKAAHGQHLLFLNPDAVIDPGAVNALIACGEGREAPWLAGGLLLDVFGDEQRGARRGELTLWSAFVSFSGLAAIMPKLGGKALAEKFADVHWEHSARPSEATPVPVVSGAFMLTPAAHFRRIGGFDEDYFLHVEDIDLCRRIGAAGGEVVFAPDARAKHYGSTSRANRLWIEWQKGRGLDRYFRKFARDKREVVAATLLSPMIRAALMARALYFMVRVKRRSANMKRLRALASERRAEATA